MSMDDQYLAFSITDVNKFYQSQLNLRLRFAVESISSKFVGWLVEWQVVIIKSLLYFDTGGNKFKNKWDVDKYDA